MKDEEKREKAILYDADKCIGCNACVLACKAEFQWSEGFFANRIKKMEHGNFPHVKRNFIRNACMHCKEAACMLVCPAPGAITRLENGVVYYNHDKCIGCQYCIANCPFGVPFYDRLTKKSYKCNFCQHRTSKGKEPACVATCLTGALNYADRDDLLKKAQQNDTKIIYGENELKGLHVLYALTHRPSTYGLKEKPEVPGTIWLWHKVFKPMASYGVPLTILGTILHYLIHGPHKIEEGQKSNE